MAFPANDRLTTYVTGAQVKSADLNEIQDASIQKRHGTREMFIGPGGMVYDSGDYAVGGLVSGAPYIESLVASPAIVICQLPLETDTFMEGLFGYVDENGAGAGTIEFVASVRQIHPDGLSTSSPFEFTGVDSAGPSGREELDISGTLEDTIDDGDWVFCGFVNSLPAGARIFGVRMVFSSRFAP